MKIFDTHADIGVDVYEQHQKGLKDIIKSNHIDKWIKGEVYGLGMASFFKGDENLEVAKAMVSQLKEEILSNSNQIHHYHSGDLHPTKINALMTLEGMCYINEEPELILDWMYQQGIRIGSLTWNEENALSTGISGNPLRGLTPLGQRAIQHMNKLNMIIDVSHTNEKSFWDIISLSTKPIMATHSNARGLSNVDRNLSDQQIKAIALKGGLIGLVSAKRFISLNEGENTALTLAKHALYIKNLVGIKHLCIGFDYMDFLSGFQRNGIDLDNASDSQNFIKALEKLGFTQNEIEAIAWENIAAFLKAQLG
jgi:membrane dipeptidase